MKKHLLIAGIAIIWIATAQKVEAGFLKPVRS